MDSNKRDSLISRIIELGFSDKGGHVTAVTLDEFFDGNDDTGSFGCNLSPHPGMESFFYHLTRFESENDVEILVEIYEIEEDEDDIWPYSERVYVIGDVETSQLRGLQDAVLASELEELGEFEINGQAFHHVNALWWD